MTNRDRLLRWKETGVITDIQYDTLFTIVRKDRFSVFFELNALLYMGVLSLIAGIGWVVQAYAASWGDAVILSGLTLILVGSSYYCFSRGLPYSTAQVESSNFLFDYVLYLGCLTFALEIAYVETRFHVMQSDWDYYLLISAVLFFALAYRFDNRLVLSLALSTLAAWFGIRSSRFEFWPGEPIGGTALIYSTFVMAAGAYLSTKQIKKHFTETYFHVGTIVLFVALVSGLIRNESSIYLLGVLFFATITSFGGIRFRKFVFVLYGVIFSYVAVSSQLLRGRPLDSTAALTYLLVSASMVTTLMLLLARRLEINSEDLLTKRRRED
ncbi:MAG: DUF2157 domain-containing protein [Acidobacteria bacterium]|nr:MAG: DUF2157 domain-containing protein [Acidobacteriota bacterium]